MIINLWTFLLLILVLFDHIILQVNALPPYPPTWIKSHYVLAETNHVVNVPNGGSSIDKVTQNATFTFSIAFNHTPNLAYGISSYLADDGLGQEIFEIYRESISSSSLVLEIKMVNKTSLFKASIRYFAISKYFPHHLNTFDNVPVNYLKANYGVLETGSSSLLTYKNQINYTAHAETIGSSFKTFSSPLSNNKILLFMTSLYWNGGNNQQYLNVSASPISESFYEITVELGYSSKVTRLHYSMVIFDQASVEFDGTYELKYDQINFYNNSDGKVPIPQELESNCIIGFSSFYTTTADTLFWYDLSFQILPNGSYGIYNPLPVSKRSDRPPIPNHGFTLFYLRTWDCLDSDYYFDLDTSLCTECLIANCLTCLNLTFCKECDVGFEWDQYSFICKPFTCTLTNCDTCLTSTECLNCANGYYTLASGTCAVCNIPGCLTCDSIDETICAICNFAENYAKAGSTCIKCPNNEFAEEISQTCKNCTLSNCLICENLSTCKTCNYHASFFLATTGLCELCLSSSNLFINMSSFSCEACTLTNCLNCSSLSSCSTCNESNKFFLNTLSNLCEICSLSNCLTCLSLENCQVCNESNQYFLDSFQKCQPCLLTGCLICSSLNACTQCSSTEHYELTPASSFILCGLCDQSCACNGYYLPWDFGNSSCSVHCGDGMIRLFEECDDGNINDDDGCSSLCKLENDFECVGEPSDCSALRELSAEKIRSGKEKCNSFFIEIRILNGSKSISSSESEMIMNSAIIKNEGVVIMERSLLNHGFIVTAKYKRDIIDEEISISFHSENNKYFELLFSIEEFLPLVLYDEEHCQVEASIKRFLVATEIVAYIILVSSIFIPFLSCKIVGLELFGILQLAYFTLGSQEYLNSYLEPLLIFKSFNGYNPQLFPEDSSLPPIYSLMDVCGSFINNCNIMLLLLLCELFVALLLYIISSCLLLNLTRIRKFSLHLLKEGFVTLILFNCLNFSFSTGVSFKLAQNEFFNIFLIILALLSLVLCALGMQFTSKNGYGEFKQKFKDNITCQLFIPFTVFYRIALGFYASIQQDYSYSTLIILVFAFLFVLFLIVNLPFTSPLQNYRSCFIHLGMIIVLLVGNYYRAMKENASLSVKSNTNWPAILELSVIGICLVQAILVLAYEVFNYVSKCRNHNKESQHLFTEESLAQIGDNKRAH